MGWIMSHALLLPLFPLILLCLFSGEGSAEKAEALFVFGDSYADTGNGNPFNISQNRSWRPPYGLTWPGFPAGRYSSGKIQTDFWADMLGLPTSTPYEFLKSHDCKKNDEMIRGGVNFAVGGSGITRAFAPTSVPEQVKQFKKLLLGSRVFDSQKLSRSVVLISVAGNDYLYFVYSRNASTEGLSSMVRPVVSGIVEIVKQLYKCGLRNFVVSGIGPLGCLPEIGKTSCDSNYDETVALHMKLLKEGVNELLSTFKGLSIIIPNLVSVFNHIFSTPGHYGFVDLFLPCCAEKGGVGKCGVVDKDGRPLFEVCENSDNKLLWDMAHPTHRGWYTLMSLYSYGAGEAKNLSFIEGASNTIEWLHSLGFNAHKIFADV